MPKNSSKESKISVIMPVMVHDEETLRLTQNAIDSINATGSALEWIIVDNASNLGGGYLRSQADIYIREKENVGFPKAVNQGIMLSTGKYVCIANNDIIVSKSVFKVAERVFGMDEGIGSVHYKMLSYGQQEASGKDIWPTGKERWCTSSFFVVKGVALIKFDEAFGVGGFDDWDYWHRFRHKNGWKTAYTNMANYQHLDSHTQNKRDPNERATSDHKNREYFRQKHGQYPETIWQIKYPKQMRQPWKPFP